MFYNLRVIAYFLAVLYGVAAAANVSAFVYFLKAGRYVRMVGAGLASVLLILIGVTFLWAGILNQVAD